PTMPALVWTLRNSQRGLTRTVSSRVILRASLRAMGASRSRRFSAALSLLDSTAHPSVAAPAASRDRLLTGVDLSRSSRMMRHLRYLNHGRANHPARGNAAADACCSHAYQGKPVEERPETIRRSVMSFSISGPGAGVQGRPYQFRAPPWQGAQVWPWLEVSWRIPESEAIFATASFVPRPGFRCNGSIF